MQVLQGSLVALVTPMFPNGDVDYVSLERLIDWHIEEGTNGIVSVGTTGESATLNLNEHIEVISHTCKYINKRVPVIAGTVANSTKEAVELTQESKLIGADYALIVTPYYNKPNQKGLISHYETIANAADINQILYNVPSRTACDMHPKTVDILSSHKNIVGIKEALDDMTRIKELVDISKNSEGNFFIYSGDDPTFMESMNIGTHGVISVAANVIPKSISNICKLMKNDSFDEARLLNIKNSNLYKLLFTESNPIPVKWMLFRMGLIQNSIRLPLIELDKNFHDEITSEMLKLELL